MKIVMFLAFTVALTGSAWAQRTPAASGHSALPASWQRFEVDGGSFSAMLPGKPSESVDPAQTFASLTVQSNTFAAADGKKIVLLQFAVITPTTDTWTRETKVAFMDGLWNGVADSFNAQMKSKGSTDQATLVDSTAATLDGYAARQFRFTLGEWHGYLRIALVGTRSYGAMMMDPDDSAAMRDEFFGSIMIRKPAN